MRVLHIFLLLLEETGVSVSELFVNELKKYWISFVANSDDEDEPNEQPVRTGGGKRPRVDSPFTNPNKRTREETSVWKFFIIFTKNFN